MERQPVTSSNVKSVGYDAQAKVLEVEFVGGAIYQYDDVPADVHAELLASPSIGRAFGTLIRGGGYAVNRLAPEDEPEDEDDEDRPAATTRQGEDEDEPDDDARSCRLSGDDEARARWMDHKYGRGNW